MQTANTIAFQSPQFTLLSASQLESLHLKGIEINADTLLLDEIHKAGPGGEFLTSQETLKRFRQYWYPGLLDRQTREAWLEDGGTTLGQRLQTIQNLPLPAEVDREFDRIIDTAEADLLQTK
jgi:trimethylamine--corrinoid protein Co-methyltransferase